jgi:hypothetical protein
MQSENFENAATDNARTMSRKWGSDIVSAGFTSLPNHLLSINQFVSKESRHPDRAIDAVSNSLGLVARRAIAVSEQDHDCKTFRTELPSSPESVEWFGRKRLHKTRRQILSKQG